MAEIQLLPPEEARKIAAGEVIDRPAALVREFIDNALDAGGALVEVVVDGGGIKRVEVSDDGCGMERRDLELAALTHATSKIRSLADLSRTKTLGFRGEALAAAAAVSRLEIITSTGSDAWLLRAGPDAAPPQIEAARRTRGTSVRSSGLFDTIPARKRFLKRESSEALLCRQIFIDKALAFPERGFRFIQDGKLRHFFTPKDNFKLRFAESMLESRVEPAFLHEIHSCGNGFNVKIVVGGPEIFRVHRREQFVFANGRRINDFALQQAFEYGTQGAFPNGTHPVGAIFIDVEPQFADFNIHPAKREAKFSQAAEIHHTISSSLRVFFHELLVSKVRRGEVSPLAAAEAYAPAFAAPLPRGCAPKTPLSSKNAAGSQIKEWREADFTGGAAFQNSTRDNDNLKYLGTAFNLFILVEKDETIFAIDQHAAHERILYTKLLSKKILCQELLVPIPFNTSSNEEDSFLNAHREALGKLGVAISGENGAWRIEALPVLWRASDSETVRAILDLKNSGENLAERWAATLSCHSALREGQILDGESALELAREALELPVQSCPHGRPFVVEIKKEGLMRAVRRV
ncbi:MAG: DNA mismatch repair endonuclease MutL [Spirochaetaceae bacterium]|jgi:DNA mismatch repair protein MutL|nr:DNA mismatch repair endonuclease MutL [Spirochaetaceae bacterium]